MTTTIGLKLDDDTRQRLQRLGETRDRAPHWLMKTAIREYLERQRLDDEQRWQRWVETGAHIDHDSMATWLDDLAARADRAAQRRRTDADGEEPQTAVADERGECG